MVIYTLLKCVMLVQLLAAVSTSVSMPNIDLSVPNTDVVCRLLKLSQRNANLMEDCCSGSLIESRKSLCEKCKTSSLNAADVTEGSDYSLRESTSIAEYNFVINVMRGLIRNKIKKDDDDATFSTSTSLKLPMENICPKESSFNNDSTQLRLFSDLPPSDFNIHDLIVKSVSYFTNNKLCTPLPPSTYEDFDALKLDETKLKELLNVVLTQIYQGIPFCAQTQNKNIVTSRLQPTRANKVRFMKSRRLLGSPALGEAEVEQKSSDTTSSLSSSSVTTKPIVTPYKPGYKGWIATFISILIISLISIGMIIIVGLRRNIKVYRYVLEVFVASAVSALLTDSLLHLYPHSLGVHDHGEHDNHHHHHHEDGMEHDVTKPSIYSSSNFLWKGILVIATLYIFYMMEYLMMVIPKLLGTEGHHHHHHHHEHHHDHHHDHIHPSANKEGETRGKSESFKLIKNAKPEGSPTSNCQVVCKVDDHIAQHRAHLGVPMDCVEHIQEVHANEKQNTEPFLITGSNDNPTNTSSSGTPPNNPTTSDVEKPHVSDDPTVKVKGKNSVFSEIMKVDKVVWMLTIGDALHNTIDGMIIATQFMEEWPVGFYKGIMTSVAILCHEVPHEVGDYAAMLASGLSVKKAIFFNSLATIACLFGGVIGCWVGTSIRTAWVEPIVAGIFLYIALTILMPNLIKSLESSKNPWILFLCHTFGYLFGATILIALSFHEDALMSH